MMNNYMRTFYMLALFLLACNANALNITVTTTADSGAGSLRQAILDVNAAGAGPHNITFDVSLTGQTINSLTNLPAITVSGVTLNGDINNDNVPDITIDAGTGNNAAVILQGTAAANNTTIKGFILQDTGNVPIYFSATVSGITIQDIVIKHTDGNLIDRAILFQANVSNLTITNITVSQIQAGQFALYVIGTTTNAVIDNFDVSDCGSVNMLLRFGGVTNTVTIKNSTLDLDNLTSGDDGNYGVFFDSTTTDIILTDVNVLNCDVAGLYFALASTGVTITRYTFTTGGAGSSAIGIRFANTANTVTIDTATISLNVASLSNDGDNGMLFSGNATNVTIKNTAIHDAQSIAIRFNGTATTLSITDTTIDNLEGLTTSYGIYITGVSSGVTLTNVTVDGAMAAAGNDADYGVYFIGNASNITINNLKILNYDVYGLAFNGTSNTVNITDFTFINGRGGTGTQAMRFNGAGTGITMNNILLDMDNTSSTNDGDLGIYFLSSAATVNINNVTIHDAENAGIFVALATTDFTITNGVLDSFDSTDGARMIWFNANTTNITLTDVTMDCDITGTTNDADHGLYFNSTLSNNVKLTRVTVNEADLIGIAFFNANDCIIDNCTITNSGDGINISGTTSRARNEIKNSTIDASTRVAMAITTDNATNEFNIHNNTFSNTTGTTGRGVWLYNIGGVKNIQITNNIFSNNSGEAIYNEKADGVLYSQNSYFNNAKGGIDNVAADGNNGLEKSTSKVITILSSKNGTVAGTYDVTFSVPSFCTNCTVEFYGNLPADIKNNGRTYVQTETALAAGTYTRTLTYAGDATGYWTATLRDMSQNGSVSEFSDSAVIQIKGPAGVINGLGAWWRADRNATTATWDDYSGNGHNMVNNGVVTANTNTANFNPAMSFSGSYYDYNNNPIFAAPVNYDNVYVFAVGIPKDGSLLSIMGERSTSGTNDFRFYKATDESIQFGAPSNYQQITANYKTLGGFANVPNLFGAKKSPTSLTSLLQGKEVGTPVTGAFVSYSSTGLYNYVGAVPGSGSTGNSEIAELIVYQNATAITALEIQKVNSYLALKYGISLDQTTPTDYLASDGVTKMWNATTNALYSKDIAGIGRDDASALIQKQSAAVNPSENVTIGFGGIAASNDSNTATFAADKTFLVWGHDAGALTLKATELPAGALAELRYNREWKVQETGGNVNNLTLRFKNIPTSVTNLELFIDTDNDGDFSTGAVTIIPGTLVGTTVTFTGIDLNNNDSFTLGYSAVYPGGVSTGSMVWLKADSGVVGTTAVTSWEDQSGNNRNADIAVSDPELVAGVLNYNPVINFDGNDYFRFTNNSFVTGFTAAEAITVLKSNATGVNAGHPYDFGGDVRSFHYKHTTDNIYQGSFTTDNVAFNPLLNTLYAPKAGVASVVGSFADPNLWNIYGTYSAAGNYGIQFNGQTKISSSTNVTGFSLTANKETIGETNSYYFRGDIGEVILYNRVLTNLERQRVNSYIAIKYGITIDQTTPTDYVASNGSTKSWNATTNAAYSFDITGIGRDDATALNQKQSKSVNADNVVAIGLGTIATDNASNSNTFTADKNFLVWGNDNASLSLQTTERPTAASVNTIYRMGREWKVQETGPDTGLLSTAFNNIHPSATSIELYVDTDGDGNFANATVITGGTLVGKTVTFSGVNLKNNDLFTVGYTVPFPGGVTGSLAVWLKADSDVVGTTAVTSWGDQSTNVHDADIATSDPALVEGALNYNPVINFDGNDSFRFTNNSFVTAYTAAEAITVVKTNVTGVSSGHPYDFGGNNRGFHYRWSDNNIYQSSFTTDRIGFNPLTNTIGDAKTGAVAAVGSLVDPALWNIYGTHSAAGNYGIQFNGQAKISTSTNVTGFNLIASKETIGATDTYFFNGDIGEVILYSRVLTNLERQRVNSYTALKYGITLDQTVPYDYLASNGTKTWDATANAAYKNNIAGIGRDDLSALNQKQSRSINSDVLVSIGLGSIATTNKLNANTFATDKSFLVWGNDNASIELQTTERPTAANAVYRMGREWKVQETGGDTGLVSITMDNVHPSATNIELYVDIDGDGDFTNASVITGGTLVGKTVTFSGVNLKNNDLFTIGYTAIFPGGVPTNLGLWLKADAGTGGVNQDDGVGVWTDQSPKQINAAAVGDPTFDLTNGTNFNPTIYHDG
ncbi:beta strand repeat-containing protein, partial [Flavobacterium sp.]|uniref:beta strand repeat-containing protein n=1 Tax=Flavobacterium sp. TaxID=239 RepID=UPI003C541D9A